MRGRSGARLGWACCALAVAGSVGALLLALRNTGVDGLTRSEFLLGSAVAAVAFTIVGALVAARQPGNRIAWVFLPIGVGLTVGAFASEYGFYALIAAPGTLPGGVAAAWLGPLVTDLSFYALPFLPLLFPNGRLPGRRWRLVVWALVAYLATMVLDGVFTPGLNLSSGASALPVANPLGIAELAWIADVAGVVAPSFSIIAIAALAAVVVRGRRARGAERQQCKWFAFGVVSLPAVFVLGTVPGLNWAINIAVAILLIVPLGIAILRHRLFDIDVLINRTLVYGLLTATLAALYFGGVTIVGAGARAVTGEPGQNGLAVVASTLAVAALFQPLRRRIQATIDRRFYRHKYDATKIIARFATAARSETDLDGLAAGLLGTVDEAMQPAHTSLWLRATERERR